MCFSHGIYTYMYIHNETKPCAYLVGHIYRPEAIHKQGPWMYFTSECYWMPCTTTVSWSYTKSKKPAATSSCGTPVRSIEKHQVTTHWSKLVLSQNENLHGFLTVATIFHPDHIIYPYQNTVYRPKSCLCKISYKLITCHYMSTILG